MEQRSKQEYYHRLKYYFVVFLNAETLIEDSQVRGYCLHHQQLHGQKMAEFHLEKKHGFSDALVDFQNLVQIQVNRF